MVAPPVATFLLLVVPAWSVAAMVAPSRFTEVPVALCSVLRSVLLLVVTPLVVWAVVIPVFAMVHAWIYAVAAVVVGAWFVMCNLYVEILSAG